MLTSIQTPMTCPGITGPENWHLRDLPDSMQELRDYRFGELVLPLVASSERGSLRQR